ncbi:hypothetical protein [Ferrovibrio sp.]|uniref:hypothetical protein n=1 Tax=Ferrovibrio sp. TaxID=1917215 RepID=UPI000CC2E9B5|nr:hypothetical protein [Ferrovibrio sp.]PJI42173.1 MAG: hypothetical protein CTR53_06965 [Ferrovibrio sp.]
MKKRDGKIVSFADAENDDLTKTLAIRERTQKKEKRKKQREYREHRRRVEKVDGLYREIHSNAMTRLAGYLPNKSVTALIANGVFTENSRDADGLHRRRLLEYEKIHQSRALKRSIAGAEVVNALTTCSPQRPSGILCSPVERLLRSYSDKDAAERNFFGVPQDQLFFATALVGIAYAKSASAADDINAALVADREWLFEHMSTLSAKQAWYRGIRIYRVYELEVFWAKELRRAYALYQECGGKRRRFRSSGEDDVNVGEIDDDEFFGVAGSPETERYACVDKMKTLLAMGWDPEKAGDVILLHSHWILNLKHPAKFEKRVARHYALPLQFDLKSFYKIKSRRRNMFDLVDYCLKAAPRYGRLIQGYRDDKFLNDDAMVEFAKFSARGYDASTGHYNWMTSFVDPYDAPRRWLRRLLVTLKKNAQARERYEISEDMKRQDRERHRRQRGKPREPAHKLLV